jgi:hypothetical protein
MRCAPCVEYRADRRVKFLDEDARRPVEFALQIEHLLASQMIVLVTCPTSPKMYSDLDYFHDHFALSPDEIVAVSGTTDFLCIYNT